MGDLSNEPTDVECFDKYLCAPLFVLVCGTEFISILPKVCVTHMYSASPACVNTNTKRRYANSLPYLVEVTLRPINIL